MSAHPPQDRRRLPVRGNDGARSRTSLSTWRLAPPRTDAAVDGEDHARGITGAVGGEVRHEVANLPGMRGAAEWQALLEFLVAVLVAELVPGAGLEQGDVTIGA